MSEEHVFEYQPTDDHGRAWGPLISIKYTTDDELREALEEASADVIGKLAQAKLKTRTEELDVPAERYDPESPMSQDEIEQEALKFTNETPAYHGTPANFAALVAFMQKHNLRPTAANWNLAFTALDKEGLLTKTSGPVQKHVKALTIADIDRMPADVYKRRLLNDPEFAAHVEALYR
jgi:hypothetical protein